jgi:hypothetical protein
MEKSCAKFDPNRKTKVENLRKTLFILVSEAGVSLHRFSQSIKTLISTKRLSFTPNFKEMDKKYGRKLEFFCICQ